MINISYDVIAIAALAISLLILVYFHIQNTGLRLQLEQLQDRLYAVESDVNAVCSGAVSVGEHLAHLEKRAHQLVQRQEQLEMHEPSTQSYRHASKLISNGANLEEVMENCGLARGEAELVVLAQRIKKAS